MENLFIGAIITIPNIAQEPHLVLSTIERDEKKYALLTEVDGDVDLKTLKINKVTFDITKSFVVSYNKNTNEILYDPNEEIINEFIHKIENGDK